MPAHEQMGEWACRGCRPRAPRWQTQKQEQDTHGPKRKAEGSKRADVRNVHLIRVRASPTRRPSSANTQRPQNTHTHKTKRTLTEPAGTGRRLATRAPSSARRTVSDAAPVGFHPPCPAHAPGPGTCRRRCAGDQGGRERADSSAGRGGAAWTVQENGEREGERDGRVGGRHSPAQQKFMRCAGGKWENGTAEDEAERIRRVSARPKDNPCLAPPPALLPPLFLCTPPPPKQSRKNVPPREKAAGNNFPPSPQVRHPPSPPPRPCGSTSPPLPVTNRLTACRSGTRTPAGGGGNSGAAVTDARSIRGGEGEGGRGRMDRGGGAPPNGGHRRGLDIGAAAVGSGGGMRRVRAGSPPASA